MKKEKSWNSLRIRIFPAQSKSIDIGGQSPVAFGQIVGSVAAEVSAQAAHFAEVAVVQFDLQEISLKKSLKFEIRSVRSRLCRCWWQSFEWRGRIEDCREESKPLRWPEENRFKMFFLTLLGYMPLRQFIYIYIFFFFVGLWSQSADKLTIH